MNKTHIRAYTKAMHEAGFHSAAALEIELAVGIAVLYECEPSRRLARETLVTIYHAAGWKCDEPGALDWRKVNRRITASVALYDFMNHDGTVAQTAEGKKSTELVEVFRPMIAALKVKSVNEVLLACDKVRPPRKPAHHSDVEGTRINAGHIHITIPSDATREDLIALATQLMTMAAQHQTVEAGEIETEAA
jgi:hypothetical protein